MGRRRIGATAAAALIGTAGFLGGASALAAPEPGSVRTLRLVEREDPDGGGFVDLPPAAASEEDASAGDTFFFTGGLYSPKGRKVGRDQGYCTFIDRRLLVECSATIVLANGTILLKGGLSFRTETPTFTVAVIGGTGAFEGVRGSTRISERRGRGPTVSDFLVRLIY
jgi:hypothetical protein